MPHLGSHHGAPERRVQEFTDSSDSELTILLIWQLERKALLQQLEEPGEDSNLPIFVGSRTVHCMHSVLSSLPYTDWGLCLSLKLQPVRFKLGWFEKGKTPHIHTAEKSQQKSGVLQRGELRRAQEQAESRPPPPGSGRDPRGARPRPPSPPLTLPRRWYLQVGRGGRHGGDPRRLPGEGLGRRQATGRRRLTPGAARAHAGQRLGTSRLPPSGTCSETTRHSDSARPSPRSFRDPSPRRRARVPPLPQNFRFRHQHAPHPIPGCRGLAFALGLARPGRGSRNPAEAWRKSACT